MEFSTGYRNIAFAARQEQSIYSATTGELLGRASADLPTAPSLHIAKSSTAFVFDSSISAGISPVWGQRYRFEISANHGSLTYTTALALPAVLRLPGKLTLAGRTLHFGRYGGGAEDPRMQDISLGYTSLVRGYTIGSFRASECGARLQIYGDCPALDQLFGSRIAVANAELRMPLLGVSLSFPAVAFRQSRPQSFMMPPRRGERPRGSLFFKTIPATRSRSYGATVRVNLLGIAIGQMSYVRPLDRGRSWHLEFALASGF